MTAVFPSLPGLDIGVKRTVLTSTSVQAGTSGKEQRASWWSSPKYEYEVTFNALRQLTGNFTVSQDEAQALSNFFTSLGGQFTPFYFTDPLNSVATALSCGAGDGSTVTFTLTDSAGVSVVPNGSPSFYRNDWQGNQLLYSTSRTNLLIGSYNSLPQNNGPLINLTATSGVSDPAGTNQAWTLTATAAGAYVAAYSNMTGGYPATTSMWLRRRTGSGQIYILDVYPDTPVPVTLTTSWQRFSRSGLSSPTYNVVYWGVELATSGDQVDVAFGQIEYGSVLTSYIPTTSAPVSITDYTLTGNTVTLAVAPLTGAALTWSGSFYYTVRFVQDNLDYEQIVIGAWKGDSLKLRTVK